MLEKLWLLCVPAEFKKLKEEEVSSCCEGRHAYAKTESQERRDLPKI
jgi:hypothetical protein